VHEDKHLSFKHLGAGILRVAKHLSNGLRREVFITGAPLDGKNSAYVQCRLHSNIGGSRGRLGKEKAQALEIQKKKEKKRKILSLRNTPTLMSISCAGQVYCTCLGHHTGCW
jgi:hypothetical protein